MWDTCLTNLWGKSAGKASLEYEISLLFAIVFGASGGENTL